MDHPTFRAIADELLGTMSQLSPTKQTDKCQKCGGQFVAKAKETKCNVCIMKNHCEVSNSISDRIITKIETNIIIF